MTTAIAAAAALRIIGPPHNAPDASGLLRVLDISAGRDALAVELEGSSDVMVQLRCIGDGNCWYHYPSRRISYPARFTAAVFARAFGGASDPRPSAEPSSSP